MKKFSILVVNYHTEKYIAQLLSDLTQQSMPSGEYEVVIANNVQTETLKIIVDKFTELSIRVVPSAENIGFGRGNNTAANIANGQHFILTNPDIRISDVNYLQALYDFTKQQHGYGLITTKVMMAGQDKSEFYEYEFDQYMGHEGQTCWFSGALTVISAQVYRALSGFDSDFFLYCEDEDLGYRVLKSGLPLVKCNTLSVHHEGGASEPQRGYEFYVRWYRSRYLFAYKHYSSELFGDIVGE